MHISVRYEVSMIKLSLRWLYTDADKDNDNNTQWTEQDCIGSLPNEPKSSVMIRLFFLFVGLHYPPHFDFGLSEKKKKRLLMAIVRKQLKI